ncbi:hypothetical protein LTR94_027722, partial [Friedmanniomyces endolithicus]
EVEDDVADAVLSVERIAELGAAEQFILTVTETGFGKRSSAYEYRRTGRGGQGLTAHGLGGRAGTRLAAAFPVEESDDLLLVTSGGQMIRTRIDQVRIVGRSSQGVTIFRTGKDEKVVSVERLPESGGEADDDTGVTAQILIDGEPPLEADLLHQALVNYGAYSSFRVQGGAARGLDLHLERLDDSAKALFGQGLGAEVLRRRMAQAVKGRDDCWLRVSLFSNQISHRSPDYQGAPRVMTIVSDPPPPLGDGFRLMSLAYQREAAEFKHVAGFGQIRARREARAAGLDDALFVDESGHIGEGALWNIGFLK